MFKYSEELLMAQALVTDELWGLIQPLIPQKQRRFRFPGRKRIDDRAVLTGIIFVLKTGIPSSATGNGMRLWHDLLATASAVAPAGRLAEAARGAAGEAPWRRSYQLEACTHRLTSFC